MSVATIGLPIIWTIGLITLSIILSLFAGLIAAYAGAFIGDLLSGNTYGHTVFGIISLISLVSFLIIIFWSGLGGTLAILSEVIAAFLIAVLAFLPETESKLIDSLIIGAVFTVIALAGSLAGLVNMALTVAIARVMALPRVRIITASMALFGIVVGALLGVRSQVSAYFISVIVGLAAITLGAYVGWQAISDNKKYSLIRSLAVGIVAYGGTKFRNADLTDADFTQATLKSVDFRNAILTRTCWFNAQNLEQARIDDTYLKDIKVRQLVTTKDGRDINFDYLNLRRLNLHNANLENASFVSTDLSLANLENANLSGAKLAQSQLYQANLNHAYLTGAYIQNWGISTDTQLEAIKCEYIYMRLPTKNDPDPCRKPDNRNEIFKEGDFADFIAPIIKTLDLYQTQNIDPRQVASKFKTLDLFHYEGIDPTAAAIAITQLADNYPEAGLEVVSLEGRGQEKIRLQAIVAGNANRSELYNEYFRTYSEIKSLSYSDLQALLIGIQEKDERIRSLENLLGNAIHQPKFYVETYQTQGDFNMSQSNKGNVSISGTQGNVSGVAAAGENQSMTGVAIGAISGNVTNSINQLPESSEPDEPGIKQLLTQLQTAIETDTNLSDEDKAEALEQVQKIAEAGQKPEDEGVQKTVKKSVTFLKGIISDLPSAVELVKSCATLLPLVTKFFGLP
ncbi:MAG: pentapeptide repeat-containing protein [Cyanomargarita calcarea GSE-NOS-MK-12-04C]|jgi:uncharacterized protein YjbI with pentapeptide repeats|uniref:Pentapeptide repeat-containing protein n=1 Tax=Cyanomargarita calcarea GSE-NOS-MK-12-04C TaxID=2839659 RepID=A0A951QS61_9CYAN|nr:pentapeptide repeat-containing protein [Cyanomargarita calcarea GSE-NOS-MK-12-04C]